MQSRLKLKGLRRKNVIRFAEGFQQLVPTDNPAATSKAFPDAVNKDITYPCHRMFSICDCCCSDQLKSARSGTKVNTNSQMVKVSRQMVSAELLQFQIWQLQIVGVSELLASEQ